MAQILTRKAGWDIRNKQPINSSVLCPVFMLKSSFRLGEVNSLGVFHTFNIN